MTGRYAIETAPGGVGAVSVFRVVTDDAAAFFQAAGVPGVAVGSSGVRRVFGVDAALVARTDERTVLVMPHGGGAIARALVERFEAAGLRRCDADAPDASGGPEAVIETEMARALARAASPRAIDLLLDQPRRWGAHRPGERLADGAVLDRLVDPPLVVAAGPANIGKSSLLNAMAGVSVALAFDRPGTTRDAVGVLVELDGLAVRWLDTPGVDSGAEWDGSDPLGSGAQAAARAAVASADLVLWCADASGSGPQRTGSAEQPGLTVATRCDRSRPSFPADAVTSAADGTGLADLSRLIRQTLVPDAALAHPGPWRFWGDRSEGTGGA
jgi:tRNA modification GTPase